MSNSRYQFSGANHNHLNSEETNLKNISGKRVEILDIPIPDYAINISDFKNLIIPITYDINISTQININKQFMLYYYLELWSPTIL